MPLSYARFFVVPFLNFFFLDERKAVDITTSLRLDVPQIAFLLRDTDKEGEEKAKRIYHEAFAAGVGKREVEAVTVGGSKKEEIERTKEGEEEEKEARNQKTFADFF
ncbi:unnamed protein product [marine sediment metagenome]|uniref:Uncharacterized protein n=1 Tax=marine sediment metagenome TaxID=412755 RepID=X1JXB3_9ZZZZ